MKSLLKKAEASAALKPKKTRRRLAAVCGVLVVLGLVLFLPRGGGARGRTPAYAEAPVESRTITSSLTGSGTLQPASAYTVTTLVQGDILSAGFEEGDTVEKGTVLYEIDSSDAANNIEKSQLSLNQAQRSYDDAVDSRQVRSAISGAVFSLSVEVGDEVGQGQEIAVVRDGGTIKLTVPFPADDAKGFSVGQAAEVLLDGSFEKLSGTVTAVSGSDQVGTGNMMTRNVTVSVKNPGGLGADQAATVTNGGAGCAAAGKFTYQAESTVTAAVSGTVTAVHVREGAAVSRDQVLVTLGGDALESSIQNARDNLRSAQLSMDSTQNQMDNYTLTSPISGTVVDKQYKAGDTVAYQPASTSGGFMMMGGGPPPDEGGGYGPGGDGMRGGPMG